LDNGELCKKLGVLITYAFFLWMILTCLILINRKRVKREALKASGATAIEDYKFNIADSIFYGLVILAITITSAYLMFYTYRMEGTELLNGYSTFSDLSPHTAMVSSFGRGFNFPTQYMHFSGNGIRYHFLFYFLAGTLQYLGLPIDYALNMPSIISMVCALVLLGLLAILLSSRRASFLIAPILVFFRSSLNVFFHISEYLKNGSTLVQAVKEISASSTWYAKTDYDNWGIWAINVYPNQRHLMLGISVILILVILFLPFVRRLGIALSRAGSFGGGIKAFIASKNAWLIRSGDPLYPLSITILACVLVIVMPYFHGSCLIALLLVLFGMAIFSESRLLYAAVAVCAVASSFVQTLAFSGGYKNVVSFEFMPGFILENPTFSSVAKYLLIVTGLTLILAAIFALTSLVLDIIRKKPVHRFLLFLCVLNPMIFAFLFKVSLEILANHKFIQVSLILIDAFVAALIANLLYIPIKRRKAEDAENSADEDIADASALDGELAVVETGDAGIRTPVIAAASAFGEASENSDDSKATDIKALEEHTGVDADISGLNGNAAEEKVEEIKEEALPAELMFGDEKKDSGDEEADSSAEIPEEIFEVTNDSAEAEDTKKDESSEESSEEKSEDTTDENDDSDDAVMASTPEPAHAAMRPGSLALSNTVTFGEDEPDDAADANVAIESAEEPVEVTSVAAVAAADIKPDSLKHEPVTPKKPKGLALPAWIALEIAGVILAIALMVPLTATGVSEWATYVNLNRVPLTLNADSPVTKWVMENTDPDDVFLTPMWSMNRFILAGRPMYYGWPYYAWSAGHDTYTRDTIYLWLITGCGGDIDEFTRYCKERNIRYLIVDPDFEATDFGNGITFNKAFFEDNLTQVAYFAEEDTTIYKIF
jgi:hypothetical protein